MFKFEMVKEWVQCNFVGPRHAVAEKSVGINFQKNGHGMPWPYSRNSILIYYLIVFTCLLFCEMAMAQDAADLDRIVVTATRMGQSNYKIASNVTVLDQFDIAQSTAQNIPQLLSQVSGIYIYDKNSSKTSTIDMRGFGDTSTRNVLVLVNDRKINTVDMSGPDLLQIPLEAVEKIEIVRGAGSVLYGDNAIGGVINIITKKGRGPMTAEAGGYYGSYSRRGGNTQVSGDYKGLNYFFNSKYADDQGYRVNSDVLSKDFSTRLGYEWSKRLAIDLEYGHHKDNYELPGGLDESELQSLGRRGSANIGESADTTDEFYRWAFNINPWPEEVEWGDIAFDFSHRSRQVFDTFSGNWNTDRSIQSNGMLGKYMFDSQILEHDVNFVTGIDYYENQSAIVGSGSNTDNLVISKDEYGAYLFSEVELIQNLYANGGTRYQVADYTFNQRDGSPQTARAAQEWVSMGGARYEYAPGSNLHFNAQQTFRFLTTDEWYSSWTGLDTTLKHQTGVQYEVGVKHNYHNWIEAAVTPYWIENKNEIFYDPNAGWWGANSNYEKTRRLGLENGLVIDLFKLVENIGWANKLGWVSGYTYQKPEFIAGLYAGKDIPLVPRHQFNTGFNLGIFKKWQLSLMGHYVGARFIINDVANTMPAAKPYFVMDGKVSFQPNKNAEVYLELNNVLDKEYSPYQIKKTATTRDYFPAEEFNFLAGVKIKF